MKSRSYLILLALILLIGLFLRTYKVVDRFEFDHDSDLYSWIAKDILVNHHVRLIGQLTSAPGIYIGSLFYYLVALSFVITNLQPTGAIIPITTVGMLTVFSYFFVFSKLFNRQIGIISSFFYSGLTSNIIFDRQVFPSTLTNIWVIWYFYLVLNLVRGNFSVLYLLGILISLIWQIHIALLPTLIAIPVAILLSHKLPKFKQVVYFLITLVLTSLPLILFEARHGFSQSKSFIENLLINHGSGTGLPKLILVFEMANRNVYNLFFSPQSFKFSQSPAFSLVILLLGFVLVYKKLLKVKELLVLYIWVLGVVAFFSFNSSPVSEYYLNSIQIVFSTLLTFFVYLLYRSSKLGKILSILLLGLILVKNTFFIVTEDIYHKGYLEKKALTEYIVSDSKSRGFPCVAISYITSPGENVGFRYLFWLNGVFTKHPGSGAPVYNIIIPEEYVQNPAKVKFGHIGLLLDDKAVSKDKLKTICQGENANLTDSILGYTQ